VLASWSVIWYEWYKAAHVIAAVIWVGGGTTLAVLGILTAKAKDPQQMSQFSKRAEWIGTRIYIPMSLTVLLFGIGMVQRGDLGYDHFFIIFGLVLWGVSALTGSLFIGPEAKRISGLAAERGPDDPEVARRVKRILIVARIDVILLLIVVFVMTAKPFK